MVQSTAVGPVRGSCESIVFGIDCIPIKILCEELPARKEIDVITCLVDHQHDVRYVQMTIPELENDRNGNLWRDLWCDGTEFIQVHQRIFGIAAP